jgi:hypothetical protein
LRILKKLPAPWAIFIGRMFPKSFWKEERIVHIAFPIHFNKKKELRSSFLNFQYIRELGLVEMSCCRFEMETIERVRIFADNIPTTNSYCGLGCTTVLQVRASNEFDLIFTPIINGIPKNYFHCDIYFMNPEPIEGKALPPGMNLKKEEFLKYWKIYNDENRSLTKVEVVA